MIIFLLLIFYFYNNHNFIPMKHLWIILIPFFYLTGCSSNNESGNKDIIRFDITSLSISDLTVKDVELNEENKCIYLFIDNDLSVVNFPLSLVTDIQLSEGATVPSITNGEIIFTHPDEVKNIQIVAEDGTFQDWYIFLVHHQLQNSNFKTWFDNKGMNGFNYKEIGPSYETSIWATANLGTSIYGQYGTQPLVNEEGKFAKIMTDSTKKLPLTAATLFTGKFNLAGATSNPTDPREATIFGTPFTYKPTAMQFKFKYQAGEKYIQATLNDPSDIFGGFTVSEIEGEDQCSIYAILEKRSDNEVYEIARAELISETTQDVITETTIPFNYTSDKEPTHITVVFASSKGGDLWKGAVGSTLIVENLKLIYE